MPECKIIAIDLAKDVFEIGFVNQAHKVIGRKRVGRAGFRKILSAYPNALVLFEACGTAHYWAREALAFGHEPRIIPAQHVKRYRRGNKTDRNDVDALIEANRCDGIKSVPVRSIEQQQVLQLHRLREQYKKSRTSRINTLRGFLRELGYAIPVGAAKAIKHFVEILDDEEVPAPLRGAYALVVTEIRELGERVGECETQIRALTRDSDAVKTLGKIQGIGLLSSTAIVATAGSPDHFRSGRYFASWLGLTPSESSSGNRRRLGAITKKGDVYVRTLLVHGARSVLIRANSLHKAGQPLNRLQHWAVQLQARVGHNKAAIGVANKLARISWAAWKHQRDYDGNYAARFAA